MRNNYLKIFGHKWKYLIQRLKQTESNEGNDLATLEAMCYMELFYFLWSDDIRLFLISLLKTSLTGTLTLSTLTFKNVVILKMEKPYQNIRLTSTKFFFGLSGKICKKRSIFACSKENLATNITLRDSHSISFGKPIYLALSRGKAPS